MNTEDKINRVETGSDCSMPPLVYFGSRPTTKDLQYVKEKYSKRGLPPGITYPASNAFDNEWMDGYNYGLLTSSGAGSKYRASFAEVFYLVLQYVGILALLPLIIGGMMIINYFYQLTQ